MASSESRRKALNDIHSTYRSEGDREVKHHEDFAVVLQAARCRAMTSSTPTFKGELVRPGRNLLDSGRMADRETVLAIVAPF